MRDGELTYPEDWAATNLRKNPLCALDALVADNCSLYKCMDEGPVILVAVRLNREKILQGPLRNQVRRVSRHYVDYSIYRRGKRTLTLEERRRRLIHPAKKTIKQVREYLKEHQEDYVFDGTVVPSPEAELDILIVLRAPDQTPRAELGNPTAPTVNYTHEEAPHRRAQDKVVGGVSWV